MITGVAPNSAAARQGLAAGDVIMELAGTPIGRIGDVLSRIAALRAARQNQVLLLVQGSDEHAMDQPRHRLGRLRDDAVRRGG